MVGRNHDIGVIGEAELAQGVLQLFEIVVGVPDGGGGCRSVDAGDERIETVALIVLRAVGIARPEHQHKRLVARLEDRQHDLCRDIDEIVLLRQVRDSGSRRSGAARFSVVAARGRDERQPRECGLE